MKLFLVIVATTVVFASGEPEVQDSAGNSQNYNDGFVAEVSSVEDPELFHGTASAADALVETDIQESSLRNEIPHTKRELRRSRCKARNSCVVMGGFCVTNTTLCSGRLVPEGCKRPGCQCCVPGTLELKIQNLEMEFQSLKHNLTDANEELKLNNSELKMELESLEMNMNISNTNMEGKLDSVKDAITDQGSDINTLKTSNANQITKLNSIDTAISNQDSKFDTINTVLSSQNSDINTLKTSNSNQETKLNSINSAISSQASLLNSIKKLQECPDGFYVSSYCFRMFKDTTRSWTSAQTKCQSEGMRLAEPVDSIAVALRKYVLDHYGEAESWLGAKGDGSRFEWQQRRSYLYRTSSLWDGTPSTSHMASTYCLELDVHAGEYYADPGSPYDYGLLCTSSHYTLCERVN